VITKLTGKLIALSDDVATFEIPPYEYEVGIPEYTRRHLQAELQKKVSLHTVHYIEGNAAQGSRLTPKLVGFQSTIEREFFEMFCSVDGLGVKKALRAMVQPVQDIATTIEQQDAKALSALPGIGPATAERVIAKLRRKMAKFALLVRRDTPEFDAQVPGLLEETLEALLVLGHSESDANQLIDTAVATGKKFKDSEAMIQAIYQSQMNK
jgi:Holliday junction DNA helicase RuvA